MSFVIQLVELVFWILSVLVVADVILSYFMSPYHPVRTFIGRIVGPLLIPIRRVVPTIANIDFSPLVLLILLQLAERLLISILFRIG